MGTVGGKDWTYKSYFASDGRMVKHGDETNFVPGYFLLPDDTRCDGQILGRDVQELYEACEGGTRVTVTTYKSALYLTPENVILFYQNTGSIVNPIHDVSLRWVEHDVGNTLIHYEIRTTNPSTISGGKWDYTSTTQVLSVDGVPLFKDENAMYEYLGSDNPDATQFGGSYGQEPTYDENTSDDVGDSTDFTGIGGGSGLNLIKLCKLTANGINNIADYLSKGWLAGNVGQCLISLKKFLVPSEPTYSQTGVNVIEPKTVYGSVTTGDILAKQFVKYELGSYHFTGKFGNYLDYKPYTSIQLYLPFSGIVDIDPQDVMGGTLSLSCVIDFATGDLVYYAKVNNDGVNKTIYQWNGNCAYELPVSAEDYSRRLSGALAGAMGGVKIGALNNKEGFSSGARLVKSYFMDKAAIEIYGPATGAAGIAGALVGASVGATVGSLMVNPFTSIGNVSNNNGFGGIKEPYLIIRVPKPVFIPKNQLGKPLNAVRTLNNCHGFTQVDNIHLSIPGATKYEIEYIDNLLKTGVILP